MKIDFACKVWQVNKKLCISSGDHNGCACWNLRCSTSLPNHILGAIIKAAAGSVARLWEG